MMWIMIRMLLTASLLLKYMIDYVWLLVSTDQYELPEGVAESLKELAEIAGVKPESIKTQLSKFNSGKQKSCRYRKVILSEE